VSTSVVGIVSQNAGGLAAALVPLSEVIACGINDLRGNWTGLIEVVALTALESIDGSLTHETKKKVLARRTGWNDLASLETSGSGGGLFVQ